MKYFAMIEGVQKGPIELNEMVDAGVRPDTYVWCKGMPDWVQASQVPDICRYFRLRLAGVLPSQIADIHPNNDVSGFDVEQEELINQLPPMARNLVRKSGIKLSREDFPHPSGKPKSKLIPILFYLISIALILLGFFILKG